MLSGSTVLSDVSMESDKDLPQSWEDWLLGSSVAEEENEGSWSSIFLLLGDRTMFSTERMWDVTEEATCDPADSPFSACVRRSHISNIGFEVSVNSSLRVPKDELEPLPSVDNEASEPNLPPSWMVFWLLVKLLPLCCCRVVCRVDG